MRRMKRGMALLVVAAGSLGAAASACGSNGNGPAQGGDAGATGDAGGGGPDGGGGGGDGGAALGVSLPQFVHGAARVDTTAFPSIPVVIHVTGGTATGAQLKIDGTTTVTATSKDPQTFVATVDATKLSPGSHTVDAVVSPGGSAHGTLVADTKSLQFTSYAKEGPAYSDHLLLDQAGDRLAYTWVSMANGTRHQLFLNYLDGAGTRLLPADVVLSDPNDEAVSGYTAFSGSAVGAVYHVNDAASGHWRVKMRVVDASGAEKVPAVDLTPGEAAFSLAAAGVDPGGFSAAWLQIRPPPADGGALLPVQLRWARWDMAAGKLVGPVVIDSDQPPPAGSTQGTLQLEPLAELGVACNTKVCVVLYSRDVYNALVQLNVAKLFVAVVDLASGQTTGQPQAVEQGDWDTQMFGQQIVGQPDGSFVLVYTANDTASAVTPKSPCDSSMERDLLFTAKIDAAGKLVAPPKPVFDFQGSREYPRVAAHPAGWALFWEDQRSECNTTGGHLGMAMNVAAPDMRSLLDPYLEAPGSIGLPPEYPTIAVTGTSFVAAWSDNRDGNGLTQPKPELFFETYWR